MKKRMKGWRTLFCIVGGFALSVVLLGALPGMIYLTKPAGIAAAAEKASAPRWEQNSDGLVFINLATESDLGWVPEMPIYLVAKVLLNDEPAVALELAGNIFKLYFPSAPTKDGKKYLTMDLIRDFRTAVQNFVVMIKDMGVPADGREHTIFVRHQENAGLGFVEEGGKIWHIADLVNPIRVVGGSKPSFKSVDK